MADDTFRTACLGRKVIMTYCLARRSDPLGHPVAFDQIDLELCQHLGIRQKRHETYGNWIQLVQWTLSCGMDLPSLFAATSADFDADPTERLAARLEVVSWLCENFVARFGG